MEAVKRAFQAIGRQSYEELRALLADDVVFSGPLQPETRGADEMIAGLKKWDEAGVRTTVECVEAPRCQSAGRGPAGRHAREAEATDYPLDLTPGPSLLDGQLPCLDAGAGRGLSRPPPVFPRLSDQR